MPGQSFTMDGTYMGGTNYKLFVVDMGESLLPQPRIFIEPLVGADGAAIQGSHFNERYFPFQCRVAASSDSDRDIVIANIKQFFRDHHGSLSSFVMDWESGDTYQVMLIMPIDGPVFLTGAEFPLQFVAPDPWPT